MNLVSCVRRRKALVAFLLIFLPGCCFFTPCGVWEYADVCGSCPEYSSSVIIFPRQTELDAVSIEIANGYSTGVRLYVNLHFCGVECDEEDQTIPLEFQMEGQTYTTTAQVFEGGQHLLLPDDATDLIIGAFLSDQPVEIHVDEYHATIPPSNFCKVYNKLMD